MSRNACIHGHPKQINNEFGLKIDDQLTRKSDWKTEFGAELEIPEIPKSE